MITFNNKSNLLEDSVYHYELQDVREPKLYRELFSYEEVPKIAFNSRHVPMNMPEEIWITDTTFRDGQQSTSPFTVKQIVDLYKLMSRLGGGKGLVRQSEFFVYSKKDKEALLACRETGLQFPEITTWIRADEKDFSLVKELEIPETGILVSCSDYHIFKKMHLTRRQAVDKYLGIVKSALSRGIRPRCHFEDITRAARHPVLWVRSRVCTHTHGIFQQKNYITLPWTRSPGANGSDRHATIIHNIKPTN